MKKILGFSLIELLVVLSILGVIAVIGIVAYDGYLTSSGKKLAEYEKARMVNDSQEAALVTCLTDCISIEN